MRNNFVAPEDTEQSALPPTHADARRSTLAVEPGRVAFLAALAVGVFAAWRGEIVFLSGDWFAVVTFAWVAGYIGALVRASVASSDPHTRLRTSVRSETRKQK